MSAVLPWLVAVAIFASLPLLIRWGKRHARGSAGGVAMLLGLAFGHLFDPAKAAATENLQKQRESHREEAEASGE